MESLLESLQTVWTVARSVAAPVWDSMAPVFGVLAQVPWLAFFDILIMTCLAYQVYIRLRGTRALRVLGGVVTLGLGGIAAQKAGLLLTAWFLSGIGAAALIVVLILFQAEIRQLLERLNPGLPAQRLLRRVGKLLLPYEELGALAAAIFGLAEKRCGALFVFERRDLLEPLLRSPGTVVNADLSPELLETLFTPPTPLHDGAVYIRMGKIYRAGCVLPLSENRNLASFYGTRHRAALGLTERSDAVAVVVSEERGAVSIAEHTGLQTVTSQEALVARLGQALGAASETNLKHRRHWFNLNRLHLFHLVTDNWRPKLVAFAVIALVWFVLVGRQNTEVGFSIPLVYTNVPQALTLQDQQAQQVYVSLRGSREMLNFVDPDRLRVTLNLEGAVAGRRRYTITPADINFPPGLQVSRINPSRISVQLHNKPPDTSGSGP